MAHALRRRRVLAALKVAERLDKGVIVCIFPDRGEKYLSTALFK